MKFSVIIPVYNAQQKLSRCLDSLLSQDFNDYEIIVVNDGSTDSSDSICINYAKKYKNVKYEYKANGGASSARNKGIELAQGDYILFVDSDDYVDKNFFATLSNECVKNGLAVFTYTWLKKSNTQKREIITKQGGSLFDKTKYLVLSRTINSPYAKVFDRRLIESNNLRFDEKMPVAEDFIFCFNYATFANEVKICNDSVYFYDMTNENSLVHKRKDGLIDIYPYVFNTAFKIVENTAFSASEKYELNRVVDKLHTDSFITCVMEELKDSSLSAKQIKNRIKNMCVKFYGEFNITYGYENYIHYFVRFCIKHKCANALYYSSMLYFNLRK